MLFIYFDLFEISDLFYVTEKYILSSVGAQGVD
jgi:hypothetical protein